MPANFIHQAFTDASQTLEKFCEQKECLEALERSLEIFITTLKNGGTIYSCGNGGSMCDAMHFAEELSGKFRDDRPPVRALAISDPGYLSCVANDYSYEKVYSRFIEGFGTSQDVLLAISTSGNSKNVIEACKVAQKKSMKVIGLTGKEGGELKSLSNEVIIVPSSITDRIQEIHIKIIHTFIEGIERNLFPQNYS